MADPQLGLPIRTEADGTDQRVQVKIVDSVAPATQQCTVDTDKNLHVLAAGHEAGGTAHTLLTDANGRLIVVQGEGSTGADVNDYKDAAAIAAAGTDNHDYTVTAGKTLTLKQIVASAAGKMKVDVQIETGAATNVFNTKFTLFNSVAFPIMNLLIAEPIIVAAGVRVRLICTNRDNQAEDLYSTVVGEEN